MEKTTYSFVLFRLPAASQLVRVLAAACLLFTVLTLSSVQATAANTAEVASNSMLLQEMPHVASPAWLVKAADVPIPISATYKQPVWFNPPDTSFHDSQQLDRLYRQSGHSLFIYLINKEYCTP